MFTTAIDGKRYIQEPTLNPDQIHSAIVELLKQNSKLIEMNYMVAEALVRPPVAKIVNFDSSQLHPAATQSS
jgi:hypothetical protein